MRLLHVIPTVSLKYGGPSVAIRAMTEALVDRGHAVTVATTDTPGDAAAGRTGPLSRAEVNGGVTYRYFEQGPGGRWMFSWGLTRWLAREVHTFHAVHVHGLFQYPTIPACRFARAQHVPYIIRPLGMLDAWSLAQRAWKKRPYLALIERSHIRNAAAIHATSEAEAGHVRHAGATRVVVIPLGVDPPSAKLHRSPRSGDGLPLRLLFLSRLHPKKGIPVLLDAVQRARAAGVPVVVTLAGSGEAAYESDLRAMAVSLGIDDIVTWAGHVEGKQKADLLASSDLFVLPSSQENFGIAVAEALSAGMPVLASREVAIADELQAAGAGRSLPIDARTFADAIIDYARRPEARLAAGRAAADFARRSYSWPVCAERLEALYQRIVADPATPNQPMARP